MAITLVLQLILAALALWYGLIEPEMVVLLISMQVIVVGIGVAVSRSITPPQFPNA